MIHCHNKNIEITVIHLLMLMHSQKLTSVPVHLAKMEAPVMKVLMDTLVPVLMDIQGHIVKQVK